MLRQPSAELHATKDDAMRQIKARLTHFSKQEAPIWAGWPTLRLNLPRSRLAHLSRFSKGGYHLIQAPTRNSARRCSLINTVPASP